MAADLYKRGYVHNENGERVLPITRTDCIYDTNGNRLDRNLSGCYTTEDPSEEEMDSAVSGYMKTANGIYLPKTLASNIMCVDESGAQTSLQSELNNINGKFAVENILNPNYKDSSKEENGITWTVNDDGSITINGTATKESIFYIAGIDYTLTYGSEKIIFSLGNKPVSMKISAAFSMPAHNIGGQIKEIPSGSEDNIIKINSSNGYYIMISLSIPSGATIDNVTVYPMIEKGETAHNFVSYNDCNAKRSDLIALTNSLTELEGKIDMNTVIDYSQSIKLNSGDATPSVGIVYAEGTGGEGGLFTVKIDSNFAFRFMYSNGIGNFGYTPTLIKAGSVVTVEGNVQLYFAPAIKV